MNIQSSAPAGILKTPPLPTAGVTFEVDVSRTYRNKDGYQAGGYKLNVSFETETHTPETFIESVVKEGWPYTMVFNHDRWPAETGAAARDVKTPKHIENFISRQELTFDDDSQTTGVIDFWLSDPFFGRYGFAFVESVNSIAGEAEKGHPTIILDRPICDPAILKSCYKAMAWHYDRLDPLHNIDRTIYNAEGARVHLVGNVCPWPVFKDVILQPWLEEQKRIEAERDAERARRQAEYEQARADGRADLSDDAIDRYMDAAVRGIVDFVATRPQGERHASIFWAGVKIGSYEAADWTKPDHLAGVENEIIAAVDRNGAGYSEAEILRTFNHGRAAGEKDKAEAPQLYHTPAGDLHSADGRLATPRYELKPYVLSDEAKERRDEALREAKKRRLAKEAAAEARAAELDRRGVADLSFAWTLPVDAGLPEPEFEKCPDSDSYHGWSPENGSSKNHFYCNDPEKCALCRERFVTKLRWHLDQVARFGYVDENGNAAWSIPELQTDGTFLAHARGAAVWYGKFITVDERRAFRARYKRARPGGYIAPELYAVPGGYVALSLVPFEDMIYVDLTDELLTRIAIGPGDGRRSSFLFAPARKSLAMALPRYTFEMPSFLVDRGIVATVKAAHSIVFFGPLKDEDIDTDFDTSAATFDDIGQVLEEVGLRSIDMFRLRGVGDNMPDFMIQSINILPEAKNAYLDVWNDSELASVHRRKDLPKMPNMTSWRVDNGIVNNSNTIALSTHTEPDPEPPGDYWSWFYAKMAGQ